MIAPHSVIVGIAILTMIVAVPVLFDGVGSEVVDVTVTVFETFDRAKPGDIDKVPT